MRVLLDEQGELQEFGFVGKAALLQSNFAAKKEGKTGSAALEAEAAFANEYGSGRRRIRVHDNTDAFYCSKRHSTGI
ncbi:hypothetical protein GCM10020331_060710 [Ectobacillus funiculus]